MTKKQIKNKIQVSFYNFRKSHDPFITWEEIDGFYSFLGYELNMQNDLLKIGINGTSDLYNFLRQEWY
ncbi:hypothetical protein AM2_041 [Lactococcus phage AM2]|uniref:Uncharacterized protein n=7 Tax=Audreyjarvisvirus AM1 TaxID=2845188 RepID=A0A1W6JLH4_9CAUD|nr:hypothetical protein H1Z30_gp041 [Lactococcus phage AM1]ARM66346.1 hypothetical protein AM2_041 [Lactococcus phage AM2]ARM66523.1 hypothetical protein AM3_041 [Lactococcus phage AM3]ARM67076.1 hypothetical protein AM8_041 [Lactococcus phage AM8]ARM67254.1 hypothetical protein AM9_041 [Lactococcus phage AM9]ARM67433.1 hypothetical protein AM11_041 [Lactococcus phage AM11]ARQ95621.1 hypothetical protein AM12_042 [Lactococcus phage AM12]